jgi:Mce-associated membrane protein
VSVDGADATVASPLAGWTRAAWPLWALGAVALGLVGVIIWLSLVISGQHDRHDYRQSALAAARQFAVDFSTYDYRHASSDLSRLKAEATGDLRSQVVDAQKQLRDLLVQGKATARGVVRSAAVYRVGSAGAVTVIAVVDQTFTNVASPSVTDPHRYRFVLNLIRSHGHWLVNQFQFV